MPWRTAFLTLICIVVAMSQALAQSERRVALVIGNSSYREAPLKNPANDAKAMAAALQKRGFKVILRQDATKSDMENAVAEFGEQLSQDAVGLFFYAGHGMQVNGRNYLVPTDAKITSEQRVRLETLDVDIVLDQMQAVRARVSMVILDACRNNPFERRFRSFGGGLAQINAPEGTIIAYATAPGKVASDGDGANGLYTTELLRALEQPGMRVEDVFKQVRVRVSRASGGAQIPWEASSLVGDFYFANAPTAPAASPAAQTPAVDRELVFWNSVKDSGNAAELEAYVAAYPNGTFSGLARTRKAALEAQEAAAAPSRAGANETPIKESGVAAPKQASLSPAADKFDGRWFGEHGCHPHGNLPGWTRSRQLIIRNREVTYLYGKANSPGYIELSGSISDTGLVSLDGFGIGQDSRNHRATFTGSISADKLTANGFQGPRSCWLSLERIGDG